MTASRTGRVGGSQRSPAAGISRRGFVKTAVTVAAFTVVPRHVLGGAGNVPPSEKLNIAGIGVGGQGAGDIQNVSSENIVALCDVDRRQAAETFKKFPNARQYSDFRVMLEKEDKNIDAVVVATPDHVHAAASMMAIKMGKHVYCEKPLTHSMYEAREIAKAAREARVATQMGNQGHSGEGIRLICEWIWDGVIGPVRKVHGWTTHAVWPQGLQRPKETPPVPETLDWDLWLGPAPYRPYHPAYLPQFWRGWWDFGTGGLGDMGCHNLDPVVWALKLGQPASVEASCSIFVPTITWDKPFNTESYPQASIVRYEFPEREGMPPLELTWYDGGLMPRRPKELEPGRRLGDKLGGVIFIGDKGTLVSDSYANSPRLIPETRMKEYQRPARSIPRSVGHHKEWIEACKGGQPAGSNFDYAGPLTEMILLGNIAVRMSLKTQEKGLRLTYDGPNMRITNLPEANEYMQRKYRDGWTL
ncbi:MAG: Gfo/Idh/MocA family oxidoreductase [Phycisphaerae bacterium]|nr:Gfo/Idh/MocA family oxidoreductase [Phycisphaerae bacterium]